MKHFLICALAALVLIHVASGFKIRRVVYVVPVTPVPSTAATDTSSVAPTISSVAPPTVIYCSWKNNWCRPASDSVRKCKWGICNYTG
ncbi:uncharacterized protein LOC117580099 [Drosophila guanche]|uniref:Uncharacterized protein n=1 Tax=Drosophila guanche TaxID=7266 RepID=A0A3B0JRZ0_DROGU|nr:uncharacterized protein LOC117580099 [Drosophila guanche]SPP76469.1 Hypothetical predicted protein [Drosophila guanche]